MTLAPSGHARAGNNFDLLRLIAAIAVIFAHAHLITDGDEGREPLMLLTDGQADSGLIGVFVFFIISGYLITGSYRDRPAPGAFALRRAMRIMPGLIVNLVLVAVVIGLGLTNLDPQAYLADPDLGRWMLDGLTLGAGDLPLPGVAFSDNGVGRIVNGSLWTLRYEVLCYGLVLVLGLAGALRGRGWALLSGIALAGIVFQGALAEWGAVGQLIWLMGFFAAGMGFHLFRERVVWHWGLALAALGGLILASRAGLFVAWFPLLGGYLTLYLALSPLPVADRAARYGDLSFGLYIYGWPVAQTLHHLLDEDLSAGALFILSLAVSTLLAFASWHLIEKRAIAWSRRRTSRRAEAGPRTDARADQDRDPLPV